MSSLISSSRNVQFLTVPMADKILDGVTGMEVDPPGLKLVEEDPFLTFIDFASSVISPEDDLDNFEGDNDGEERDGPGWSWIASRVLKTCISYSSGVTSAILLSELSQGWSQIKRTYAPRKRPECINQLKKRRRSTLPNLVSIDSIYEKNFLSLNSVLEAVIVDAFVLPGTNIYMLKLGDFLSSNTIDLYLHRRYYDQVSSDFGILRTGREIILTGCCLRTASQGFGCPRLLPTEYMVILLDEDNDDDAMLLGAQFCADSFSSISLDSASNGAAYSLYARIESIGPLENLGDFNRTQRKQVTLVDDNGMKLLFVLWGEQVVLANILSVRSMLAIDRPFISSSSESALDTCADIYLEYGSATRLYIVPLVQKEEQVSLPMSQSQFQLSKSSASPKVTQGPNVTQGPKVSQVMLPRDAYGSVDYSKYPFKLFVVDLHDNMTGISLYGTVSNILREGTTKTVFRLKIDDTTGSIFAKLHFRDAWSLGRLSVGHTIYIAGLTCRATKHNRLEGLWYESDAKSSFVNLSCLPAMLNSSCLQRKTSLANLSIQKRGTSICRVWLDQIEHWDVRTVPTHKSCGHFVKMTKSGSFLCEFCRCLCDKDNEVRLAFHLKITVADETSKGLAWCSGQTAMELLQISPEEFDSLHEEEQVMYPMSLENERYVVAIVHFDRQGTAYQDPLSSVDNTLPPWEITRALKL